MKANNVDYVTRKLSRLEKSAKIGLWETDYKKEKIFVSEYLIQLFNLSSPVVNLAIICDHIVPEYRRNILDELITARKTHWFDYKFPMLSKEGKIWVKAEISGKEFNEKGESMLYGYIQQIDNQENNEGSFHKINDLLRKQNTISKSLMSLLHAANVQEVIPEILFDLLLYFNAGKAYILKADHQKKSFNCISETKVAPEIASVKDILPIDFQKLGNWCMNNLSGGKPIILSSIDEIPEEADFIKNIFIRDNVHSCMLVPVNIDGFWGYAGIDIIGENKKWSNEDYKWFSSLIHVIVLCIELHQSEQNAKRERDHLGNLYRYMPMSYFLLKLVTDDEEPYDFQIIDSNYEAIQNFSPTKSLTHRYGREVFEDDFDKLFSQITELSTHSDNFEFIFHKTSSKRYYRSIFYYTKNGEAVLLMSDITQTYLAQSALEKSEEILRNLYDKFPVGIELYDKNGILVDMNDKDVSMFGGTAKEDILGINIFEHPILLPEIKEKMYKREPIDFTSSFDCSMLPGYYKSHRNETFELNTKIGYLYDKQGELTNYILINIDNLDTVNAYKKIQEFEAYFSMIADYAKVGYYKWNPLTREGFAIGQWFKNLGQPVSNNIDNIEKNYSKVHPDDYTDIMNFYSNALLGKQKGFRQEIRVLKEPGKTHWLRSYKMVKVYNPENNYIEIVGMNFDITELKEVEKKLIESKEKAEAADKLKTNFLANMSHEIRTPLNAIVGFSGILTEIDDETDRQEFIDLIKKNSDLLLQLINDILDLSRIEVGKYEFIIEDIDAHALCHHAIESLNVKPKEEVTMFCRDGLPPIIMRTDKNRLLQVLNNLLNNAMKFTNKGSIELSYTILETNIIFQVKDTGIGIPYDQQDKIFERFEKLNTFIQGTGLGLSICKEIVGKMGGIMGVESKPGEGSLFWFNIPIIQDDV